LRSQVLLDNVRAARDAPEYGGTDHHQRRHYYHAPRRSDRQQRDSVQHVRSPRARSPNLSALTARPIVVIKPTAIPVDVEPLCIAQDNGDNT
jgi:hypothetical protein